MLYFLLPAPFLDLAGLTSAGSLPSASRRRFLRSSSSATAASMSLFGALDAFSSRTLLPCGLKRTQIDWIRINYTRLFNLAFINNDIQIKCNH